MGSTFGRAAIFGLALFAALPARAEDASGCDKFKWPVQREQAALAAESKPAAQDGGALAIGTAATVKLSPVETAFFAQDPERAPNPSTFGAVLNLATPPAEGVYTVSVSAPAWIDVFQGGGGLKPLAHSSAKDCANIRKTLKFQFSARKTVIQISNVSAPEISIVILPE